MTTQTFKAKDVKSAINMVNDQYGEKAIILSTKKNNGFVEIEASDNDEIIKNHQSKNEENKGFSKVFFEELKSRNLNKNVNDNVSYLNGENQNIPNNLFYLNDNMFLFYFHQIF